MDLGNISPQEATCFLAQAVFDETPGFIAPGLAENVEVLNAFLNGALAPLFAPFGCAMGDLTTPTADEVSSLDGPSTECQVLVDGVYQC